MRSLKKPRRRAENEEEEEQQERGGGEEKEKELEEVELGKGDSADFPFSKWMLRCAIYFFLTAVILGQHSCACAQEIVYIQII